MPTPQTNITLPKLAEKLLALDNICICGHANPDGDCLGSTLGLYFALKQLGKTVFALYDDSSIPCSLKKMEGFNALQPVDCWKGTCDCFVMVDAPFPERMKEAAQRLYDQAKTTITIDHHAYKSRTSDFSYTDDLSAAAALIIWELVKHLPIKIDAQIATCCCTGILTDTGGFQYQNTDALCLQTASEMVQHGASVSDISRDMFQSRTLASIKLESRVVSTMKLYDCGFALGLVSAQDFQTCNARKSDADGIINYLRSIDGVRVACVLREQSDCIRGSLRAKDDTDVASIANKFNGGGHKAAAGCTFYCSLEESEKSITNAVLAELQ